MDLITFHKESYSPYVTEISFMDYKGDHFINICGSEGNVYIFYAKYIESNYVFKIIVKEEYIKDWIIRKRNDNKDNEENELTFCAIGKREDTNTAVYLCANREKQYFTQLLMNGKELIEIVDIIAINDKKNQPPEKTKCLSKDDFYRKYRTWTHDVYDGCYSKNKQYYDFIDKIFSSHGLVDYDEYIKSKYVEWWTYYSDDSDDLDEDCKITKIM